MERDNPLLEDRSGAPLRVGLLGCGTVGSEVARILGAGRVAGATLERVAVRDADKPRAVSLAGIERTTDALSVVKDPDIDVVIELIGGVEPAYGLLRQAIAEGKHVVSANKSMLARHGDVLNAAALARGVGLLYEGAVGGAVPVVRTLRNIASSDRVSAIAGVLNGTSNYVLSEMAEGTSFDDALRSAQLHGYAEADPAEDVDGVDSAHKLVLLCRLAFGRAPALADIPCRGVRGLSVDLVRHERELGGRVKLLATAERDAAGTVSARVEPVPLADGHPLARVEGVENGIALTTALSGTISLFGPGAGGEPTAAAVIADLEEIVRTRARSTPFGADPVTSGRSTP